MKRSVNIVTYSLVVLLIIFAIKACVNRKHEPYKPKTEHPAFITISKSVNETSDPLETAGKLRIKPLGNFDGVFIYDIDGHIYNCNQNGGIVHSESCPCKKLSANTY